MSKKIVVGLYAVIGLCLLASSVFAVNMNNAGWYLHVDVQSLKSGALAKIIEAKRAKDQQHDKKDVDKFLNIALGREFKNQIQQVTVYGDQAGYGDFTVIAQGPFTRDAKKAFFENIKLGNNSNNSKFKGTTIQEWIFEGFKSDEKDSDGDSKISISVNQEDKKPMRLYSAEIDSKTIIVSKDQDEVKAWLKGTYSKKDLSREGVFSVVVHLDRAIAHGGLNFGEGIGDIDLGFDSKMMQKLTQFSFSLSQDDSDALIEIGLVATDEKVAIQLKNIANGLISLQAMAGDVDDDVQAIVKNLSIDVDGVNLLLKTNISTAKIEKLVE